MIIYFVDVNYKSVISINAANNFNWITTTMNFVVVVQFFNSIYKNVFEYLLTVNSLNNDFFDLIFTYFDIVKTNNRDLLYLHCFQWFCETYYITNFRKQIFTNSNYAIKIIWFIDRIIKCSIVLTAENFVSIFDASSAISGWPYGIKCSRNYSIPYNIIREWSKILSIPVWNRIP